MQGFQEFNAALDRTDIAGGGVVLLLMAGLAIAILVASLNAGARSRRENPEAHAVAMANPAYAVSNGSGCIDVVMIVIIVLTVFGVLGGFSVSGGG